MSSPFGRAVLAGVMQYTSVSAVNRHTDCNRSWHFRYVQGLPDPPGKAAEFGVAGHKRLEHYLKTGEDILGLHERAGLHLLPKPGPGLLTEQRVDGVLDAEGVPFIGGMDLVDERDPDIATITDYKFKSKIGVAPAELGDPATANGRQMLAYAEAYRRLRPGRESVYLRHLHFSTRGKKRAEPYVWGPVPLDTVKKLWHKISTDYVAPIKQTAKAERIEDVTPNYGFCYAYHRACPYLEQCPQGNKSFVDLLFGGSQMGLLDKFVKLNPATSETVQSPYVPVPTAVQPAPTLAREFVPGSLYLMSDGGVATLESVNGLIGRFKVGASSEAAWRDVALATVGESLPALLATPVDQPVETKRKGRPTKKDTATPVETPLATKPANDGPWLEVAPGLGTQLRLYFGCAPVGVPTQTLHAYVDQLERDVLRTLDESGLLDVRLSGHEILQFGRWKATLAQSAVKNPPAPGHYVIPGMSGEKIQAVADALASVCLPGNVVLR